MRKQEKGITLIALILTIIVMLILISVTVNITINEGILDKTENAAQKTEIASEEEQLNIAAMGSMGTDGKVDFELLNNNLPEGIEENNGIYKSVKTERRYKVNSNGTIEVIGAVEILVAQYKTSKITIGTIVDYKELLTENKACQIVGSAFGLETNNLREFNEAFMKMQGIEMSYDEILAAVVDLTGNPNPTDRDVFTCLFEEMGCETIEQLAVLAIEEGVATYQPEVKLLIDGKDKTDIYNQDGFDFDIEYGKEYKIEVQVDGNISTKKVKLEEGKPYAWDLNKVDVRVEGENIIPIPKDFEVSASEAENSIDEGLVIKNNGNEFVWVPVFPAIKYTEEGIDNITAVLLTRRFYKFRSYGFG